MVKGDTIDRLDREANRGSTQGGWEQHLPQWRVLGTGAAGGAGRSAWRFSQRHATSVEVVLLQA